MWHGAALPRTKNFPPLSDFVNPKPKAAGIDEVAIKARFAAYNKRLKENG